MTQSGTFQLTIGKKQYEYTLVKATESTTLVVCKAARINQEFCNEDIPALLFDLPELIIAEKEYTKKESEIIRFRVSPELKKEIENQAISSGHDNVSSYLRNLALDKKLLQVNEEVKKYKP